MIGVFDSGSGGLTVLAELKRALPNEAFLYLGDHARAPYGYRSNQEIVIYTQEGVGYLMGRGCRLVVIACNTAASVALRTVQQDWLPTHYPENRVLGVLVPMVEALAGVPWHHESPVEVVPHRHVLLFATSKTVESRAYLEEVHKRAPACTITQQACPDLAAMIERGEDETILQAAISSWVIEATKTSGGATPDAAVLGCTHYPLVSRLFAAALPSGTAILSQPELVAEALTDYLHRRPAFAQPSPDASITYLTTGQPGDLVGLNGYMPELGRLFDSILI